MEDKEIDGKSYSQTDYLTQIGFQAQPGDIYYMNPPKELSSYPVYIDNPRKMDKKPVGQYIAYTMDGTDLTEQVIRRYSDFYSLYEKLLQRWPGIYIPRVPPKKIIGNMNPEMIKTRMRLLNRFLLNLSNIDYLYKSEESSIFRNNIPDVGNAINKLKELSLGEILSRMKEAFPEYNGSYDINTGKIKINEFDAFLKKCEKTINDFQSSVETAREKRDIDIRQYIELIKNFSNYEKDNMMYYAENNENALIFFNPTYNNLSEKILKLKQEMINPFLALRDWLQEDILDVEAMQIAIKQLNTLCETKVKLQTKLRDLDQNLTKGQQGQLNIFKIKTLFKKKEDVVAQYDRDKELTQQKINDIEEIIKIVGDNMENQIEIFKADKTKNYYKYLKIFAIMQREANRVVRELWNLVKSALDDISPNHEKEEDKTYEENYGQNEIHENVENLENQEHTETPENNQENQENQESNEGNVENNEENHENNEGNMENNGENPENNEEHVENNEEQADNNEEQVDNNEEHNENNFEEEQPPQGGEEENQE